MTSGYVIPKEDLFENCWHLLLPADIYFTESICLYLQDTVGKFDVHKHRKAIQGVCKD